MLSSQFDSVSVLFATGNGGVSGLQEGYGCSSNDLVVILPSGWPNVPVISVGGTIGIAPETATSCLAAASLITGVHLLASNLPSVSSSLIILVWITRQGEAIPMPQRKAIGFL